MLRDEVEHHIPISLYSPADPNAMPGVSHRYLTLLVILSGFRIEGGTLNPWNGLCNYLLCNSRHVSLIIFFLTDIHAFNIFSGALRSQSPVSFPWKIPLWDSLVRRPLRTAWISVNRISSLPVAINESITLLFASKEIS